MPPKRMSVKGDNFRPPPVRAVNSKGSFSKGLNGAHNLCPALIPEAAAPEIDIEAAIQEYISESMAKLTEAVQDRTEQLIETIASVEAATQVKRKV
jgi:hypothetical protein